MNCNENRKRKGCHALKEARSGVCAASVSTFECSCADGEARHAE